MTDENEKSILDALAVPVVVAESIRDKNNTITDFSVVYVNDQHRTLTQNFLKVGDTYETIAKILPAGIAWFPVMVHTMETGADYEDDYFSTRVHTWFHMVIRKFGDEKCIFTITDVTPQKVQEGYLKFLKIHDFSTGLPNMSSFRAILSSAVKHASKKENAVAVVMINIDNMWEVNSFSGWDSGDDMIRRSAAILSRLKTDTVFPFRLSRDEFAVVTILPKSEKDMMEFAEKMFTDFTRSSIGVSMGLSFYPDDAADDSELLKHADIALRYVKNNGKGTYRVFDKNMYSTFLDHLEMHKKIISGLEKKEFMLYFQPQYYLSHELRGFEALIRWKDESGWHPPVSFIPIAEETNAIQVLGAWILETAAATLKRWQDRCQFKGILSVNVSPAQMKSPLFLNDVDKLLEKYPVLPGTFEFEVTEGVFISDVEKTAELLKEIQKRGIRISLDDFGTGYSSLRYLASMPVNTLKLDKSFIDNLGEPDNISADIVTSLVSVTKRAGLETIAEGVEHPEQLGILTDIECNCVQGFLWGKPIPPDRCERLLGGDKSAADCLDPRQGRR